MAKHRTRKNKRLRKHKRRTFRKRDARGPKTLKTAPARAPPHSRKPSFSSPRSSEYGTPRGQHFISASSGSVDFHDPAGNPNPQPHLLPAGHTPPRGRHSIFETPGRSKGM